MNDRKMDILEAALDEFASKSYDDASINTIIKTSKTSKGTFYHYFSDKKDLYLQVMRQAAHAKLDYIQTHFSHASDQATHDIFDLFKQHAIYGVRFAHEYPRYGALNNQLLKEKEIGHPIFEFIQKELAVANADGFRQLFLDAYEKGTFKAQFSLDFIIQTTEYLLNHFDDIYFTDGHDLEERLARLYELIDFLRIGFGR